MDKFSKFLLYAAIVFKLLLILVLTRYAFMRIFDKDNKKIEQIEVNKGEGSIGVGDSQQPFATGIWRYRVQRDRIWKSITHVFPWSEDV